SRTGLPSLLMRRALLSAGALVLLAVLGVGAVVVVRAVSLEAARPGAPGPAEGADAPPDLEAVERLAGAVRIATVSGPGEQIRPHALQRFRRYLAESFPRVHAELRRELVAGHSLLYTWPAEGAARGAPGAAAPLVLLAHQDVVPAGPEAARSWTHPPFEGVVADGYLWGRGTLDDKASLLAILEAVEGLLADGFRPRRPVILAFGHDEEIGGRGAVALAERLGRRGVEPFLVLDEGLAIADGLMPGIERPVALVGVAEKGYLSLVLRATGEGGHSSAPPRQTAVDVLARALQRLRGRPLRAGIDGPVEELFTTLAAEVPFDRRLVLANLWLFEPLVVRELASAPATDALLRTTTAPTMLDGSVKDNVLPTEATAVVNFRLHPRDTSEAVIAHVRRAVNDPRVAVEVYGEFRSEASPAAPTGGPAWELLTGTIARVAPEAAIAPSLVLAGTDARHYTGLSRHVYRFVPFTIGPGDLERVHGIDERLALEDYGRMVRFYRALIEGAG
ncbi:MAG TPA: M20 family peptidase, partial [Thermoanaerobaculia bacterium]|nr:M20 family peptidase [Thermoanaerobaculia bacterium]